MSVTNPSDARSQVTEPDARIKVLALAPTLGQGGAERVLSLLLQHLDRDRFIPELAVFEAGQIAYHVPGDVPVHVLADRPAALTPLTIAAPPDLALRFDDTLAWLGATAAKLAEFVREQQPDVVISSPLWASIMVSLASSGFPPHTAAIHRVDAPPSVPIAEYPWRDLFAHFISDGFPRAEGIVAVAGGVADDLVNTFGVVRDRITVVHNPATIQRVTELAEVEVDDIGLPSDAPIVLFVGRLERVKGLEHLFRAIATVVRSTPVHLVLIGEGSQFGYLNALAKHLKITKRVHFIGRQENPFRVMRRAAMLVLPSLSEGMSNVLVEAMACGCPIVATDIKGGVSRELLVDGEVGVIVPIADDEMLAHAIGDLLMDPKRRSRLADAGIRRARDFDLPLIMAEYEQVIIAAYEASRPPESASIRGRGDGESPDGANSRLVAAISTVNRIATATSQVAVAAALFSKRGIRYLRRRARGLVGVLRSRVSRATLDHGVAGLAVGESGDVLFLVSSMESRSPGVDILARELASRGRRAVIVSVVGRASAALSGVSCIELESVPPVDPPDATALVGAESSCTRGDVEWLAAAAASLAQLTGLQHMGAVVADGWEAGRIALIAKRLLDGASPVLVSLRGVGGLTASPLDSELAGIHLGAADAILVPDEVTSAEIIAFREDLASRVHVLPEPLEVSAVHSAAVSDIEADSQCGEVPCFVCVNAADDKNAASMMSAAVECAVDRAELSWVFAQKCTDAELRSAVACVHAGGLAPGVPTLLGRALALGCPVIATRSSDSVGRLLDDGKAGVLVRPGDAAGLADALLQLLWDDQLRDCLADAGRHRLETFSAHGVATALETLVSQLTEGPGPQ